MLNHNFSDPQGRRFPYLRLSVTDVCNYSCQYCLPDGYQCKDKTPALSGAEIKNLISAFAELGTWKIRITGGEPSVRKDLLSIIESTAETEGIRQVAMTTNGYQLLESIESWCNAGLSHLNVSVDSLDPRLFADLTGHNRLASIMQGIERALELPLQRVKLNAVLLKSVNAHQIDSYCQLLKHKPLSVRFIELMQTGDNLEYFNLHHVPASQLIAELTHRGWRPEAAKDGAGPAVEYRHPDFVGSFGVIAPYAKDFCQSCNRLRISANGKFHLCLFGDGGYSIRHLLTKPTQRQELKHTLCQLLQNKKPQHFLHQGNPGATPNLSWVGG